MVSKRVREKRSVGNRIIRLESEAGQTKTQDPVKYHEENSVDSAAIATDAVTSEQIAPQAVNTEQLGMVREIKSDSGFIVYAPGAVAVGRIGAGSTAERNAIFGTPTTDPERVALANRKIRWNNTDTGWEESFYAPSGLAGLTARPLFAGMTADWYPTGTGTVPMAWQEPIAAATASAGSYVGGWNGTTYRTGGSDWFSFDPLYLGVNKPGVWEYFTWTAQQSGAGTAGYHMRILDGAGATYINGGKGGAGQPLAGSPLFSLAEYRSIALNTVAQRIYLLCQSGSLAVHQQAVANGQRGQMYARYIAPPLVAN